MKNLHSSMVRLEISCVELIILYTTKFTFQYGQIRNLDLLIELETLGVNLHSSMVRLEI